ncbi:MAG: glycoside hydrolase family 57 protein [Candidatus Woesearchaeota archaeon]
MGDYVSNVCFYFQVHQPFRMRKYRFLDIGKSSHYFDAELNKELCEKVAKECYLPANKILLEKIKESGYTMKVAFGVTGVALEQFEQYVPEVIDSFKELADTGCVEFLGETYYHSLSSSFSESEFDFQVDLHKKKIESLFGQVPKVFRNTELIYDNEIAKFAEKAGFEGILSEGADHVLGWRSANHLYRPKGTSGISLLLKNFKLSDDIAFRFSDKSWAQWPLTAEKYSDWIASVDDAETINIFMDYETFGEHHDAESGIFSFLADLPGKLMEKEISFITPSEAVAAFEPKMELDVPNPVSWADAERDMSAWLGNKMQESAASELFKMEQAIKASGDQELLQKWRLLSASDHLYYMSTKKDMDGLMHNYFSPYNTPYDSFISYMNILKDMTARLGDSALPDQGQAMQIPQVMENNLNARRD